MPEANEPKKLTAEQKQELTRATRAQLARYRSHKEVLATKIASLTFGYDATYDAAVHLLIPADTNLAPIPVTQEYLGKHNPVAPGYFVVYPDGYESWSPVEAFEGGYTQIEDSKPDTVQDLLAQGLAYREPIDNGDRHQSQ